MVFTSDRIENFDSVKQHYTDFESWKYIFLCHNKDCQRVFNTSNINNFTVYRKDKIVEFISIAWDDFVRDVLPTL